MGYKDLIFFSKLPRLSGFASSGTDFVLRSGLRYLKPLK
jgi:hypothetical protein